MQAWAHAEIQCTPLSVKIHIKTDQDECLKVCPREKKKLYDLFADRMVMMRPFA